MPAKKKFTLGVTNEFMPIWNEFQRRTKGSTPTEIIRKLIFGFVNNDIVDSQRGGTLLTDDDWNFVTNGLKIYKKFIDKELEMKDIKNDFYVDNWNDYYNPVWTQEEADSYCIDENYEIVDNFPFPDEPHTFHLKKKTSPNLEGKVLLISDDEKEKAHQKMADSNPNVDVIIKRFKSKPDYNLVIHRERFNGYDIVKEFYRDFKKKRNQTVYDLVELNYDLALSYSTYGLFKIAPELIHLPHENVNKLRNMKERLFNHLKKPNFGEDKEEYDNYPQQILSKKHLTEKYGGIISKDWKETPPEIEDFLILKTNHLVNMKELRQFRRNNKIKYQLTPVIVFSKKTGQIIGFPGAEESQSWNNIQDATEIEKDEHNIIEV